MPFLGNTIAQIITASLILQIIVLIILIYSYLLKRKLQFRKHGIAMASAVILHMLTVFSIMIPSFTISVLPDYILAAPLEVISILATFHVILGAVALGSGTWLVASWHFKKDLSGCFKRKRIMIVTITFWVISIALGATLYSLFIGPVLG